MSQLPARTQGIIASGLLAILVLSVFAGSTYTGPESTIYRLHTAVATGDTQALRETLIQQPTTPPSRELLGFIAQLLSRKANVEIRQVQSQGRNAVVLVVYSSPSFGVVGVQFYMHKARRQWQVDTDKTLGALVARARN